MGFDRESGTWHISGIVFDPESGLHQLGIGGISRQYVGSKESVMERAIEYLEDQDPQIKLWGLDALCDILDESLNGSAWGSRYRDRRGQGAYDTERRVHVYNAQLAESAVDPLITAIGDNWDYSLYGGGRTPRSKAVEALGKIGDARAVGALIVQLENELEDFEFNQDFDFDEEDKIRSPGWIRYQKRIK